MRVSLYILLVRGLMGDRLLMDLKRARKRASHGGVVAHSLGP